MFLNRKNSAKAFLGLGAILVSFVMGAPARGDDSVADPSQVPALDMAHVPAPAPGFEQQWSSWCRRTDLMLKTARRSAEAALQYGDYTSASRLLREGLVKANQSGSYFRQQGPITARAVYRGVVLADAIQSASANELNGVRTLTYFLFSYYDFVFEAIRDLDLPLYLPYRSCGLCDRVNATVFERQFLNYARRQVELVLSTLAEDTGRWSEPVYPIGAPTAFLKALEISAGYAAQDIRESLWSSRHACAADQLMHLSQDLAAYNGGAGGGYYDEVDAVNRSYREASRLLDELNEHGCGYSRRSRW